jgi:serine/threonine-protein kinase
MVRRRTSAWFGLALCACGVDRRHPVVQSPPLVNVSDVQPAAPQEKIPENSGAPLASSPGVPSGGAGQEQGGAAPTSLDPAPPPSSGAATAPAPPATNCATAPRTFDQLFEVVATDLGAQAPQDQPFLRYVSLTNQVGPGDCAEQLEEERAALAKGLNMLSLDALVRSPAAIDAARTLFRIDLRDYDWDRSLRLGASAFTDVWEAIAASNPYAVPFVGDTADDVVGLANTAYPIQFADQLLHVALTGSLYYALLGVDERAGRSGLISNQLEIDLAQHMADEEVRRAFTTLPGVMGQPAHLVQRDELGIRAGALWQSFGLDMDSDTFVQQSLFGVPAAAGEAIFTLPNGLFGFVIFGPGGTIVPDSDTLLDANLASFRVSSAVSCSNCHQSGLLPVVDLARDTALANVRTLGLDQSQVDAVERIYAPAEDLARVLELDSERYRAALQQLGLVSTGRDPVASSFLRFEVDLTLADAAGDLGVTSEQLQDRFALQPPQLAVLANGTLDRDDFTEVFVRSLCDVSVTLENRPLPSFCDSN